MPQEKNAKLMWTYCVYPAIISVLFLAPHSLPAQTAADGGSGNKLTECEMARRAAEDRCLELNATLIRTEKELEQAKQKLADALQANSQLRDELAGLRLKAANVLVNSDNLDEANLLAQTKRDLQRIEAMHLQLANHLQDYRRTLDSVLDVLDPKQDSAFRRLLDGKLEVVKQELTEVQSIAQVSATGTLTGDQRESRVLAINDDLGVVVLDAGRAQGIRIGSAWQVVNQSGRKTELRIIETRHSLSAAIATEGTLRYVAPGATALLITERNP